ncbi:MAG: hypothetical protein ABIA21_00805, partial [Candidatus Aenigmatarchaeota archaeon]
MAKRILIKEVLYDAIRREYRQGTDIRSRSMLVDNGSIYYVGVRLCGSWPKAFNAADLGLDYVEYAGEIRKRKTDARERKREEMRCIIREKLNFFSVNEPINYASIKTKHKDLHHMIESLYKNHSDALRDAGLDPIKHAVHCPRWNKKNIMDEIISYRDQEMPLRSSDVMVYDRNLHNAAVLHFGSWRVAIEACGMNYREISRYSWYSDEDIFEDMVNVWMTIGKPTKKSIESVPDGKILYNRFRKHFG